MSRNTKDGNIPGLRRKARAERGTEEVASEKLQKVLAAAGLGSRRGIEKEIELGQARINGKLAKVGDRVVEGDTVEFKGRRIRVQLESEEETRVLLYNKPEGEICTRSDPEGRPTVFDKLPNLASGRWVAVGRLDINTSGALLFTNSGTLANKLMHPSSNVDREYLVRINGEVTEGKIKTLLSGVELDDGVAKFTDVVASKNNEDDDEFKKHMWFYCVVMEGRNREVRRLWEAVDTRVSRLKRVRYGNIFIPSHVRVGQWIELSHKEINELCATAGLDKISKRAYSKKMEESRVRHIDKLRAKNRKKGRK